MRKERVHAAVGKMELVALAHAYMAEYLEKKVRRKRLERVF